MVDKELNPMTKIFSLSGGPGLVVGLCALLALGACARAPEGDTGSLSLGASGQAAVGSPQDFVVNVGDRVFFQTDSAILTAEAKATLGRQAAWLNRYGQFAVTMEGHADERGTREYNIALGARRATSARDYLIAQGVSGTRLRVTSFGKERPVAVCDDISCWSQNRRSVTVITN
jgi:peptidoglycan-associated lipoprotein